MLIMSSWMVPSVYTYVADTAIPVISLRVVPAMIIVHWHVGSTNLLTCARFTVVGQTSERIRDPSMQNADLLNSDCLIHGAITCFTGCGWM